MELKNVLREFERSYFHFWLRSLSDAESEHNQKYPLGGLPRLDLILGWLEYFRRQRLTPLFARLAIYRR